VPITEGKRLIVIKGIEAEYIKYKDIPLDLILVSAFQGISHVNFGEQRTSALPLLFDLIEDVELVVLLVSPFPYILASSLLRLALGCGGPFKMILGLV
jgi:hypothetical protein